MGQASRIGYNVSFYQEWPGELIKLVETMRLMSHLRNLTSEFIRNMGDHREFKLHGTGSGARA